MFRGLHKSTIDAKGRMKVPVRFYNQINNLCNTPIMLSLHPNDNCLLLCEESLWQSLVDKIDGLPVFYDKYINDFKRKIVGHASDCEIDGNKRILIPQMLREASNLNKKIIIIGQLKYIEIWSEEVWQANNSKLKSLKDEEKPQELMSLSI